MDFTSLISPENTNAVATIVGLLASFSSEHKSGQTPEFVGWLREQQRQDIADLIEGNVEVGNQVRALLQMNHAELLGQIRKLSAQVETLIANSAPFGGLAQALAPGGPRLSEQALSVLRQIAPDGARVMEHKALSRAGHPRYLAVGPGGGELQLSEPKHLQEDLDELVHAGFAARSLNSGGARIYTITRSGERRVQAMQVSPKNGE